MVARGEPGAPDGQDERDRMMLAHIDDSVEMLALVKPDVIVIAHTATSYHLGCDGEARLLARLQRNFGARIVTLSARSRARCRGSAALVLDKALVGRAPLA